MPFKPSKPANSISLSHGAVSVDQHLYKSNCASIWFVKEPTLVKALNLDTYGNCLFLNKEHQIQLDE